MKKALLLLLGLVAVGCSEPEISKVLDDYCEFKVKTCAMNSPGTTHYDGMSKCKRYHKDMLKSASEGGGSHCSDQAEDFFITVMESQMAGGCDYSFTKTVREEKTLNSLMAMKTCFEQNSVDVSNRVPELVDKIYDDGEEKEQALFLVNLMLASKKSGE